MRCRALTIRPLLQQAPEVSRSVTRVSNQPPAPRANASPRAGFPPKGAEPASIAQCRFRPTESPRPCLPLRRFRRHPHAGEHQRANPEPAKRGGYRGMEQVVLFAWSERSRLEGSRASFGGVSPSPDAQGNEAACMNAARQLNNGRDCEIARDRRRWRSWGQAAPRERFAGALARRLAGPRAGGPGARLRQPPFPA